MAHLHRYFNPGQIYFLTHVTYQRQPFLIEYHDELQDAINSVKQLYYFELIAWVTIPDHIHMIIDPFEGNLPGIIRKIKLKFTNKLKTVKKTKALRAWQNRYWDHIIRNDKDFANHIDYIHFNPVKHGLVTNPVDWKYSTFHDYLAKGYYEKDWGVFQELDLDGSFGE